MKISAALAESEAFRICQVLEDAAALTNNPDKADDIRQQWYVAIREGMPRKLRSTFPLVSEDVVGILLAAHEAEPAHFGADVATDAAALSGALIGAVPKPSQIARARWMTSTIDES